MHALRLTLVFLAVLFFAGTATADVSSVSSGATSVSSGASKFNGKTVRYTFMGDHVEALSYAEDGICRVTATVDGETHRIVISENELVWNGVAVPLDGFKKVKILMAGTKAKFTVDGRVVVVK